MQTFDFTKKDEPSALEKAEASYYAQKARNQAIINDLIIGMYQAVEGKMS